MAWLLAGETVRDRLDSQMNNYVCIYIYTYNYTNTQNTLNLEKLIALVKFYGTGMYSTMSSTARPLSLHTTEPPTPLHQYFFCNTAFSITLKSTSGFSKYLASFIQNSLPKIYMHFYSSL